MRRPTAPTTDPAAAPRPNRARDLGVVALALLAGIWGYGWVVGKVGLEYAGPFGFVALRTVLSAAGMFALLLVLRRPLRPPPLVYTVLIGLLQTSAFIGLTVWALANSGAGKTSVLTYTMPFWLLLLAWSFLGERLRGLQWLAVGLAFVGLVLVLSPWRLHGLLPSVLTVAAGFSWAASAVVVKLLQRRHAVDVLSLTAWQMVIGVLPLVAIAAVAHEPAIDWAPAFVWSLAYNVLLANGLGWILWLYALRELRAGAAGIGTLAVPVIGVAAAWLQLGERPGGAEAAGMALIIAALGLVSVRGLLGGAEA
ncbi:MAG: DMT family transporter, partial [Thermoleophilia bacterium]